MSKLSELIDKLFPAAPEAGQIFVPLNVEKEVASLGVKKKGEERGTKCEPPHGQTSDDAVEMQITARFRERWQAASEAYHAYVAQYRRRLDLAIDMAGNVEEVALGSVGDFLAITKEAALHLHNQRVLVSDLEDEYRHFRQANRLQRTALPRRSHVFNVGVLLFAIVAESVLNGAFLAHIFGGALLIAFLFAVGISAVNVLASLLCGIFSRYVQHVGFVKRLLGLVAILFFLAWAAGYNLFVANFRDAAEGIEWEQALIVSVQNFIASPWTLENFQSWMLALLGALISVIVFIKGVLWDDFYPGFGSLARRREAANDRFADMASEAMDEIRSVRAARRDDLQAARERLIIGLNETTLILTEQSSLAMQYATYHQQLQDATNYALSVYREANRSARPDNCPPPEYFNRLHKLPEPQKVANTEHVTVESEKLKKGFDKALEKARKAIEEAYQSAVTSIPQFDDLDRARE